MPTRSPRGHGVQMEDSLPLEKFQQPHSLAILRGQRRGHARERTQLAQDENRVRDLPEERTAFKWWSLSAYDVEALSDNVERHVASSTERQRCPAGARMPASLASYANRHRSGLRRNSMSRNLSRSTAWIPSRVEREARSNVCLTRCFATDPCRPVTSARGR